LNGNQLTFGVKGGTLKVNEATIQTTDIKCENGVIHVIDAVLLPPVSEKKKKTKAVKSEKMSATALIENAIEKGVPLYNDGNAKACADIYQECLMTLAKDDRLSEKLRDVFARVVKESKGHDDDARAWMLRRGLDTTMMYLSQSTSTECED